MGGDPELHFERSPGHKNDFNSSVTSTQNEGFEPVHSFTTPVFVFMAERDVSDVTGPCRCLNHLTFLGNLLHYHDFPR